MKKTAIQHIPQLIYCMLQAFKSTRSMIQLHCQKSPLWQVTLFPDGYEMRSLTLSGICWFFSFLSMFSQVSTEECENDSYGDCIPLWIHKKVQLKQNWHQPPHTVSSNPSALAYGDLLQQRALFKPNLSNSFYSGKGLQSKQLCYMACWFKITHPYHIVVSSVDRLKLLVIMYPTLN